MRTTLFFCTLALVFALPLAADANNGKARLVAELIGLEQEIEDTDWTWETRDDKKALERRLELQRRIIHAIATYEASISACPTLVTARAVQGGRAQPRVVAVTLPRDATDTEVTLIERLIRVEDRLDHERFTFADHDLRKSLEKERERTRETLGTLAVTLCGT